MATVVFLVILGTLMLVKTIALIGLGLSWVDLAARREMRYQRRNR